MHGGKMKSKNINSKNKVYLAPEIFQYKPQKYSDTLSSTLNP